MAAVYGDVLTPAPNGSATAFTTSASFLANSERVYLGGARQLRGAGNDYTVSGGNTITFPTAPAAGLKLLADYAT